MSKTRIPVLLGGYPLGAPGTTARVTDPAVAQQIIDRVIAHGQVGIDSSRFYSQGTSEELLGTLDLRGIARIDTKNMPKQPGDHTPEKLKATLNVSMAALGRHKIRVFYLHAPDRTTPFEDTLRGVNELYKGGYFEEFGISNFTVDDVKQVLDICDRDGYVRPTVYQGPYNLIFRGPEETLIPLLRASGIRYAAYSPLAGGYLTGKLLPTAESDTAGPKTLGHFDPSSPVSPIYTKRYSPSAPALTELQKFVTSKGLTLQEVAYRWLQWHSAMIPEDHGLVFGYSRISHVESALEDCEKGPLPDDVVQACDNVWEQIKDNVR